MSVADPTASTANPQALLSLRGITKQFQTRRQQTLALDDVTLEVQPRETEHGRPTLHIAVLVGGAELMGFDRVEDTR